MIMHWMSYVMDLQGPRPPAIPASHLSEYLTIGADGASVQELSIISHFGTHLDTAAHIFKNGTPITDFSLPELLFQSPRVVDLCLPGNALVSIRDLEPFTDSLRGADFLMIRLGLAEIRISQPDAYAKNSPGLSVEAACWLVDHFPALRGLGIDAPSVACIHHLEATMGVHHILLQSAGSKFLIVEEMKLDMDLARLTRILLVPWLVRGMHSGPCSIIGFFREAGPA